MSQSPHTPPDALQQALDWLAQVPAEDVMTELGPLRQHVLALHAARIPALHRLKILELIQQRAEKLDAVLGPALLDVKLPLPGPLAANAQGLIDLRAALGDVWLQIAEEASTEELKRVRRNPLQLRLQGIGNLQKQFLTALLIAVPTPLRLWRNLQTLVHKVRNSVDPAETLPVEWTLTESRFKTMLALATAQPEGLAPREIAFLADYVSDHAAAIRLEDQRPGDEGDWFWVEASLDQPPIAMARREPEPGRCLFFRCADLAEQAAAHLSQLSEGIPPATLGLPVQAAGADYRNALDRARQCWTLPRRRSFNRRDSNLRVEVCTHLSTLWTALGGTGDDAPHVTTCDLTTSDWTLLNEGPAGYAMVHVEGKVGGLVPGGAVGLRTGEGAAWQICLVRWARSEGSHHVELGLEVLAPSAQAVRLQTLNQREAGSPVPALLLPALPSLNRSEALLTARGDYNARPFTLLLETEGRLQVIECMPRRSLVETSSVEIFEFAREARAV